MIEKIVQTAKHAANASVLMHRILISLVCRRLHLNALSSINSSVGAAA
jgi:hypothetical protein